MGTTFGLLSALWCYWHRKGSVFGGIGGGKLKCGSNFGASQWRTINSRETMCKCWYKSPKQVPMDCWSGLEWLEEALLLSSCSINCDVNRVIVLWFFLLWKPENAAVRVGPATQCRVFGAQWWPFTFISFKMQSRFLPSDLGMPRAMYRVHLCRRLLMLKNSDRGEGSEGRHMLPQLSSSMGQVCRDLLGCGKFQSFENASCQKRSDAVEAQLLGWTCRTWRLVPAWKKMCVYGACWFTFTLMCKS